MKHLFDIINKLLGKPSQAQESETATKEKSNKDSYGFLIKDGDELVNVLSKTLKLKLYSMQSPMIGRWYSSDDPKKIKQAMEELKQGKTPNLEPSKVHFTIELNNAESGYTSPSFLGDWFWILYVSSEDLTEFELVEKKLQSCKLECQLLNRERAPLAGG